MIWSDKVDQVFSVGRSLAEHGVKNWALDTDQVKNALMKLRSLGIPVMGGDVYVEGRGRIEGTYDNWYCNREHGEQYDRYVERSIQVTLSYVTAYRCGEDSKALFALVPGLSQRE